MEDYSEVISKNLINLRKSRNLTQQEFASIFNYSDKTISKWELGYSIPGVDTLKEIADYYGLTVDYFLQPHEEIEVTPTKKPYMSLKTRRILLLVLVDLFFVIAASVIYTALLKTDGSFFWPVFVWAGFAITFFNAVLANYWWKHTFLPYLFASLAIWLALIGIYTTVILSNPDYNFWYLFFVGLPIQAAAIIILTLTHTSSKDK